MKFLLFLTIFFFHFEYITPTSPPSFIFDNSKAYNEGETLEIEIRGGIPSQTCTYTPDSDFSASGATTLTNFGSGNTVTLTLSIVSDGVTEPLEEKTVTYDCPGEYYTSATTTVTIAAQLAASGDPHFNLFVEDGNSGRQKQICFDVSSTLYKNLYIFKDTAKNITVNGILKDDYYMHQIILSLNNHQLRISLDGVYKNNQKVQDWNSGDKTMKMGDFTIDIKPKNNQFLIGIKKKNHIGIDFFSVEKSMKEISGEFLDISIQTNLKSKKDDGLIGVVRGQRFQFFDHVQNGDDTNLDASVIVNNRLIHAKIIQRYNDNCWLMDINDILFPAKLAGFLN